MRWDGTTLAEVVKTELYSFFFTALPQASTMNNTEYAAFLKKKFNYSGGSGFSEKYKTNINTQNAGINIFFKEPVPVEIRGENAITITWSMAARHIRAWEYEKVHGGTQKDSTTQHKVSAVQEQWEKTHLCGGSVYVEGHCEYLIEPTEDTVINGKKVEKCNAYCTSENKVRKIGTGGLWTGLSPKFCPKRKALEQTIGESTEAAAREAVPPPTYFDVLLQHYPNFDTSRFDEFAEDVCAAECFDDVNGCLGNTAGKHDTACKIGCGECWKNVCALQWKLGNGTEKYIEPYLKTAEKQEDTMTSNFNFKGFISEGNQLKQVPLDMLVPYHNHKFKLYEGERLDDMVNSIKENGVLTPIIVRNMGGEHYEILAGHNRTNAAKLAGLSVIPAIVKENLSDDEAEMYVIETNVMQRGFDDLSISERAAVVAARHSAMFDEDKRKAIERELAILNGDTPADEIEEQEKGEKKSKLAAVGESYGLSKDSVARLIRISKLAPELQLLIDNGGIPLRAGVNLSYLLASEQKMLVKCMTTGCEVTQLSMKQSELLRGLSHNKKFTENNMRDIVYFGKLSDDSSEDVPRKPIRVKISADIGAKYFAPDWSADKVQEIVELALERYFTDTDRVIMDDKEEYQM